MNGILGLLATYSPSDMVTKHFSIVAVGSKFFDVLEIDDRRTMNAQEYVGVQFGFEISHRIAEHMVLFAGRCAHPSLLMWTELMVKTEVDGEGRGW